MDPGTAFATAVNEVFVRVLYVVLPAMIVWKFFERRRR